MKQSRTTSAAFDLDELERELQKAAAPKQTARVDDPLAELARIVGQDQRPARSEAGAASSFEDFLASASPEPARRPTPAFEPLFPQGLPHAATAGASSPGASQGEAPPAEPAKPFVDPLEALLAQDLGLRNGLDELPEPPAPLKADEPAQDADIDEARAGVDAAEPAPATGTDDPIVAALDSVESAPEETAAAIDNGVEAAMAALPESEAGPLAAPNAVKGAPFDDMIAEFEAAIRDTAGASVRAGTAAASQMIAPPPGDIVVPPPPPVAPPPVPERAFDPGASAALGLGAGAAAIGAGAVASTMRPRRGIMLAAGAIAVAVIGLGAVTMFGSGRSAKAPSGAVPVIEAKAGAGKERPANPGGVEVPNQDKEVLNARATETPRQERVQPREEQPVDLNQAQRQAAAAAPTPVRQIPGVGVVPAAPATAEPAVPTVPQPRPVASVPIVISGQPETPAPTAPPPASIAPPAPPATPPAASANQTAAAPPAPATPPAAPAPAPTPAQTAAPRQTTASAPANGQQPISEPRRVRTVPIRPDSGEATPQRAQAQPRVVAAPPAASADPNAPLAITPQASRTPAAAPAAPRQAAVSPGVVPSSVPSLEQPTASAEPQRTASTGSGFSVQLAAEGSEDAARAKYNRMRGQYGSVIGDSPVSIRSAEVNGRSVYRVRVGNMSRDEAVSMCERLKASGGSCFVARN